ncbi:MAG TPA: NAD(P)-dependent oxidoreductase [Microlunatus sp.]|nr:NAD(P)-dependent oxidoreductase [Microlunatus sp.]
MRILLAGGTGVLGSRIVRLLVAAGHSVWATTRTRSRVATVAATGATPLIMDALDPAAVDRAVAEARPDLIMHQLTDLSGGDFAANARVRVEGTDHLVGAARRHGVHRMIAQSVSWICRPGAEPADERTPPARDDRGQPVYPSVEHLESSVLGLEHGVVLRYGLLYGPGTWYAEGGDQYESARRGTVIATTDRTSFVHVDDAAEASLLALDWPPGVINIVDDEPCRVADWAPVLAAAAGGTVKTITARAEGRAASNAKARALGWTPRHPSWRTARFGL